MELERIRKIIADQLGIDGATITMDTVIREDLGVDSLELYEVLTAIEEEYDIEIDEDAVEAISTVADAIAYIEEATK